MQIPLRCGHGEKWERRSTQGTEVAEPGRSPHKATLRSTDVAGPVCELCLHSSCSWSTVSFSFRAGSDLGFTSRSRMILVENIMCLPEIGALEQKWGVGVEVTLWERM